MKSKHTHVLVVGINSSGKTTLVYQLKLGQPVLTLPTVGYQTEQVTLSDPSIITTPSSTTTTPTTATSPTPSPRSSSSSSTTNTTPSNNTAMMNNTTISSPTTTTTTATSSDQHQSSQQHHHHHHSGVTFDMIDVGGSSPIRELWKQFTNKVDAIVYVVDAANRSTIQESAMEFHKIMNARHNDNVPVLVFANKQDLAGALSTEEIADYFKIRKNVDFCHVQGCSAREGTGLNEGMQWLVHALNLRK